MDYLGYVPAHCCYCIWAYDLDGFTERRPNFSSRLRQAVDTRSSTLPLFFVFRDRRLSLPPPIYNSAMKNECETVPTSTTREPLSGKDCLTCKIIGSTAFAATGLYALHASRASAPGSVIGKRIMGGLGICFLIGSVMRWHM